jgi:hypothetical protein
MVFLVELILQANVDYVLISGSDEHGAEPSFVNRMEDLARLTMPSRKGRVLLHRSDCSVRETVTRALAVTRAINQQMGSEQTTMINSEMRITASPFIHLSTSCNKKPGYLSTGIRARRPGFDSRRGEEISLYFTASRVSVVGRATGYGLDDRGAGIRVPVGSRIFSSPRRTDRLWGPPSLLSNGYSGLFSQG